MSVIKLVPQPVSRRSKQGEVVVEWSGTLCDGGMGQETHEWEEVGVEAGVRIPDRSSRRDRSVPGQTFKPSPMLLVSRIIMLHKR
jgi:hypothetical protein